MDFEVGRDKDVIEGAQRQKGREGFERDVARGVGLNIAQRGGGIGARRPRRGEATVERATGSEVEVAEEKRGAVGGEAAEKIGGEEAVDLRGAFAAGKAEVGGDDGDLAPAEGDGGVERIAGLDHGAAAGG